MVNATAPADNARRSKPQTDSLVTATTSALSALHSQLHFDNNSLVSATQLELKGHRLTIVTLNNDEWIGGTIRKHRQPWQQDLLGRLMDLARPASTVIDAGSNIGQFAAFLAAANSKGRVLAFEPQARMFQLLCTNMVINSLFNIEPRNVALSYKHDVLHMTAKVPDGKSEGQEYRVAAAGHQLVNHGGMRLGLGGEEVTALPLDSLNLQDVSLLKVDVQGAEKLLFYGARETLRRNMPVIAFEVVELNMTSNIEHELALPAEVRSFNVTAFLLDLGYISLDLGNDVIMLPPGHPALHTAT